jgi:glycosyltransferase involved in cell wall biosynthesis
MRILHVIGTLNPAWGGPVEGVRNITAQAMLRGHEVHIATLDGPESPWLSSWRPVVHALGKSTSVKSVYRFAPNLDRWLAADVAGFDRVVVHSIWMYFSYAVWKAARKASVPYYLFIHGALDPWFKQQYPLKHVKKSIYWKLVEHKVLRDAQAVLFTTEEELRKAHNAFLPYKCKPAVIGYGIAPPAEPQHFDRQSFIEELSQAHPELRGRKFILLLARIHEKKGIDLLLHAFAETRNLLGDVALIVAGSGDAKYIASLKDRASTLGISADVIWTGPLYGDTKLNALRAAEVYILPSHQENFGISVVEALACGTPVLISNQVNIWREVEASGAGFVEPDDQKGTTRLLERWAAVPRDEKLSLRARAAECFATNFNMAVVCERLFAVIFAGGIADSVESSSQTPPLPVRN